ncbi:MAG: lipoprotein-releasing ABC transporter permease subunit [Gammaproteobacteria bacterium]
MFQPWPLFVAWRYVRAQRRNRFAGFVSLVSIAGITLGVAALVIVLSVMNGFEREVTRHVLGMSAHALLVPTSGSLEDWRPALAAAARGDEVRAVSPYLRGSGLLSRKGAVQGVIVEGIEPDLEARTTAIGEYLGADTLATLEAGHNRVVIGAELARSLAVEIGDPLTLMVPAFDAQGAARAPRYVRLVVGGTFHIGMHQFDARLVLMPLADAQAVFHAGDSVSGLRVRFLDAEQAPRAARHLAAALRQRPGQDFGVIDWTQYHRNFFIALESQKRIMFVILMLIVAVAAFNIAANMIMLVTEKMRDIAILRTQGATRMRIVALFLLQGALIGVLGALLGALLGAWGAQESEAVVRFVEALLGIDLINADVYFIDYLPADLRLGDVLLVMAAALTLALLATVYPALRAAAIDPARAVHQD